MTEFPENSAGPIVKSKDTFYNDRLYRSILEARWAVFFDTLGISFKYESTKFDTPLGWYLPDFYFPNLRLWGEIKPTSPSSIEASKIQTVANASGEIGCIFSSFPSFNKFMNEDCTGYSSEPTGSLINLYLPNDKNPIRLSINEIYHFFKHDDEVTAHFFNAIVAGQNKDFFSPVPVTKAMLQMFLKAVPEWRRDYNQQKNQDIPDPTETEASIAALLKEISEKLPPK